jgi:diguanylate cyclase (GGDEF)-like protein/PAS domain S-box-containing protein
LNGKVKTMIFVLLFSGALGHVIFAHHIPLYIQQIIGAFLIIISAVVWGLGGSVLSAFTVSLIFTALYFKTPHIDYHTVIASLFMYICIVVATGISTGLSRKRQEMLTEAVIKLENMQEELEISESRYRELYNNMKSGIIILEASDNSEKLFIKDLNRAAEKIDDISKAKVLNKDIMELVPGLKNTGIPKTIKNVRTTGKSVYIPLFKYNEGKNRFWREIYIYRLPSMEIVLIYNDLSKSVKTEENLRRIQFLFEHTREIMLFIDQRGNILDANDAAIRAYGYDIGELLSMNIFDLFEQDSLPVHLNRITDDDFIGVLIETVQQRRDGSIFPAEASFERSKNDDEDLILCIMRDITQHKNALETISHMAYHDALTGLPNRELLNDRLEMAIARANRENQMLALLSLDLDNFKNINDTMGHMSGDHLLQKVSERLLHVVRKTDTVARMGGDEFIILQQDVNKEPDAEVLAHKILEMFRMPFLIDEKEFHITTSIGIALCPRDCSDLESLLKFADIAMYKAKESGKNTYQFYSDDSFRFS